MSLLDEIESAQIRAGEQAVVDHVDRILGQKSEEPAPRAETGGMCFGDDWRGVFIRGDNALNYYLILDTFLRQAKKTEMADSIIALSQLEGLAATLYQACQTQQPELPPIHTEFQQMKPFAEAIRR